MIKDNKPYTNENGFVDDALFSDIPKELQDVVITWINICIIGASTPNYYNSYSLKHMLEESTGIYLTNNQFKDAMLIHGYEPLNPNELNWRYNIRLNPSLRGENGKLLVDQALW